MFAWLQRNVPFTGSALFRGTWPLRKENFDHLRALGFELRDLEQHESYHWALKLQHPDWGEAILTSLRNISPPPHTVIEWDANLNPDEVEEIKACGSMVQLRMESKKNNILRDRKSALQFLNSILGEDGLAAMDHVGQKIWSRDALAIETAHNADLDVDGIMTYHWVTGEDEQVHWLHSHGLGEIGFQDFDILNPSSDLGQAAYDVLRTIAFHSVEGRLKPGATINPFSAAEVKCVATSEFMSKAAASDRVLREDASGDHTESRVVLCDAGAGLLKSIFGSKPHPSRALSAPYDDGQLIQFSTSATELMSLRAKSSFEFFGKLADEMSALEKELPGFSAKPLIKLGYKMDGAEEESEREHLWFEFHGMSGDQIDATLLNQPFHITRMKEGDRAPHSLDLLTEWTVFTPAGQITPANSRPLRFIRKNKERLREALQKSAAESA